MKKIKIDHNLAINTIRLLSACAINKAQSGHPGVALGAASIMYDLFAYQMNCSPSNFKYYNRDRFVLSCGHGSSLLYATMLVCGYKNITINDLKKFRQINSKTAGHPESSLLENVEVCTGPLGQGIAMAVGLAIASKKVASIVNTKNNQIINNHVYCLFGDGCFQEGIGHEAIAIAGRLKLNNLIMIYDYNGVQLDGKTIDSTSIDTKKYFAAMGWNILEINDDFLSIDNAISKAKKITNKPTVILCHTIIGYGSNIAGSNKAHGTALSSEQISQLKKNLNYHYDDFTIPSQLAKLPILIEQRVNSEIKKFTSKLNKLKLTNKKLYCQTMDIINNNFNFKFDWFKNIVFPKNDATRNIAGEILQVLAKHNPTLLTLIADVASSTKIKINNSTNITANDWSGQNINCGVREFAMAAIANGINAYGGLKALGSAFLSFSDYNKAAIRLAAISQIPLINIYSHDSITVGEDGPTHQPIEQLWSLRLIPNHVVFRPTSYVDTIIAFWYSLKSHHTPVTIITSRRNFNQQNVDYQLAKHGGYVIKQPKTKHQLTIYATGSEIELALNVANKLPYATRVVVINSLELLLQQDKKYLSNIFDKSKKISLEFGSTSPWYKYMDLAIGIDQFGYSGKVNDVITKLNLTTNDIVDKIKKWHK